MTTNTETHGEMEQLGRELLAKWRREALAKMNACSHPGTKTARGHKRVADRYAAMLTDTTRILWCITIGGYGEMFWVGTAASATGRRVTKLRWEGAHSSTAVALRPAREDETNGPAERPADFAGEYIPPEAA